MMSNRPGRFHAVLARLLASVVLGSDGGPMDVWISPEEMAMPRAEQHHVEDQIMSTAILRGGPFAGGAIYVEPETMRISLGAERLSGSRAIYVRTDELHGEAVVFTFSHSGEIGALQNGDIHTIL
jgi:hypothetical protein